MNTNYSSEEHYKRGFDKFLSHPATRIFSILIPAIALLLTIIFKYYEDAEVEVQYIITNSSNVLDINTEVNKLDILYDSTNLKHSDQNLRVVNIKVINKGKKDLLINLIDPSEPLGLLVKNAEIIETPELIEASSDYFKNHVNIEYYSKNKVTFTPVIIETGEFFIFKYLLLHQNNTQPSFEPIGKIAGQKRIKLLDSLEEEDEESFWIRTYSGGFWVQLVRFLSYLFGMIIIVLIGAQIDEFFSNRRVTNHRVKLIIEFSRKIENPNSETFNYIRSLFYSKGTIAFSGLKEFINDRYLKLLVMKYNNLVVSGEIPVFTGSKEVKNIDPLLTENMEKNQFSILVSMQVIQWKENKYEINVDNLAILVEFLEFLEKKGEIEDYSKFYNS